MNLIILAILIPVFGLLTYRGEYHCCSSGHRMACHVRGFDGYSMVWLCDRCGEREDC